MTSRELRLRYASDTRAVKAGLNDIDKAHQSFDRKLAKTGAKISRTGGTLTRGVTLPLVGLGFAAIKTATDFEKSMNTMGAVAGVPAPQLEKLGALATELGAKTVFSANEAAQAMVELAKSGIRPADIQAGALANTLDLATAGDLDLAQAAQIASNAMNTFELSGKQSKVAVDALAGAANASSADVDGLAQALAQSGQTAKGAGLNIQETTAVLGLFAQKGLQGSDAGTSLKTMLLSLVPTSVKAKDAIRELGLEFIDADGNIRPISQIAEELRTKLGGLTQAQQQAALKTIFGTDAFRAASIVMNAGAKGLKKYTDATNEQGTAAKVAAGKMKGLPGVIESLKGSAETFLLAAGKQLAPVVKDLATQATKLINRFGKLPVATQRNIVKFGFLAAAAGPVLKIVGGLTRGLGGLVGGLGKVFGAVGKVSRGIDSLAGAKGLTGLGKLLSPGNVVLAGVGLFAYGLLEAKQNAARLEKGVEYLTKDLLAGGDAMKRYGDKIVEAAPEWAKAKFQNELLAEATRRATKATDERIDSITDGTRIEGRWSDAIKKSTGMSLDQKSKLAALLVATDRYNVKLSDTERTTLLFALKTGDAKQAMRLLNRVLHPAIGAMKNMLTYTQKNADAMSLWEQKSRRQAYWLSQIAKAGGGGGGGGGGGFQANAGGPQAAGGVAVMGRSYLVGEKGKELFTPGVTGRITPNDALGGGGDTYIVNVQAGAIVHERDLGPYLQGVLLRHQRRNGGRSGLAA